MELYIKNQTDIMGMARIGWIPVGNTKGIELYVHTNDSGSIPHFHVRKYSTHKHKYDKRSKFDWETCIRYDSPQYFLHGKYHDTLPDPEIAKQLDSMLRTVNPKRRGITYWQSAIDDWNNNTERIQLDPDMEQPDYTLLK